MTSLAPSSSLRDHEAGAPEAVAGRPSQARLIGLGQIARIMAVSVTEAHQLARLPDFPAPVGEICDHVLWSRDDIMSWRRLYLAALSAEDRLAGRPR